MVVTRSTEIEEVVKGKGGLVYDARRFDFEWWAYSAIYRRCINFVYLKRI